MTTDALVDGKRGSYDHSWGHKLTFEFLNRSGLSSRREVVGSQTRMNL